MANERRIRDVVRSIERDPRRWDQRNYHVSGPCGTAYCVAGWTLANAGYTLQQMEADEDVFQTAMILLGLDAREADEIFFWRMDNGYWHTDNTDERPTVDELKEHITDVTGVTFEPA